MPFPLFLAVLLLTSAARVEVAVHLLHIGIACANDAAGLRDMLARRHGEAVVLRGAMSAGQAVEVWSTPDGASWTVVTALLDGTLCLLAAGTGLEAVAPPRLDAPKKRT